MPRTVAERADILPTLGELFREHGYEGASLTLISQRTGLGKGSLYHFFPGGKQEMAAAVLAEIDGWFETNIFAPLRDSPEPKTAIADMLTATDTYFRSGRRLCLIGIFALGDVRDRFSEAVRGYFACWVDALAACLMRAGRDAAQARSLAEDAVVSIQGALILARALNEPDAFTRALTRLNTALLVQAEE